MSSLERRKKVVSLHQYKFYINTTSNELHPLFLTWVRIDMIRRIGMKRNFDIVYDHAKWVQPYVNSGQREDRLRKYMPGDFNKETNDKPDLPSVHDYVQEWKIGDRFFPGLSYETEMLILLNLEEDFDAFSISDEDTRKMTDILAREKLLVQQKKAASPDVEEEIMLADEMIKSAKTDIDYAHVLFNYCYRGRNVNRLCFAMCNKGYLKGIRMLLGETVIINVDENSFPLDCSKLFKDERLKGGEGFTWCPRITVRKRLIKKFPSLTESNFRPQQG